MTLYASKKMIIDLQGWRYSPTSETNKLNEPSDNMTTAWDHRKSKKPSEDNY